MVPTPVRGAATIQAREVTRGQRDTCRHVSQASSPAPPGAVWGCPGRPGPSAARWLCFTPLETARGQPPGTEQLWPCQPLPPSSPVARGPCQETASSAHVPCAPLCCSPGAGLSLPTRDHEPPPCQPTAVLSGHCWNWVSSGLQVPPAAVPRGGWTGGPRRGRYALEMSQPHRWLGDRRGKLPFLPSSAPMHTKKVNM